jgi:hypothetical protein
MIDKNIGNDQFREVKLDNKPLYDQDRNVYQNVRFKMEVNHL